ncbi:unnamed protein product [Ostreobium quekettii]|uniref:Endoplasmic reticulum vesicle transporter C-terminal domain-containing protein n=1 Tax=Ostreobium quekettii TaxID=121088 RepID=A0A8S1IXX8_9CHLO|nr:unnamed protein product [Ostreobium quekettii]
MPCSWMSLDAMDISGELQLGVDHEIYRRRLDPTGDALDNEEQHDITLGKSPRERELKEEYCGSCYGAEERDGQCCNTCTEVHDAYRKKGWAVKAASGVEQCESEGEEHRLREQQGEGCALWGSLSVNKVAGNFHFAPGRSYQRGSVHVHDLVPFQDKDIDFSHHIVSLSFGTVYPGMVNPLDGVAVQQANRDNAQGQPGMFQYFLKTSGLSPEHKLPGVFFFYDLSPIKVEIREYKDSFLHFLTNVCAIVGGIFTVAGLLDGMVYFGHNALKKKVELGKLS